MQQLKSFRSSRSQSTDLDRDPFAVQDVWRAVCALGRIHRTDAIPPGGKLLVNAPCSLSQAQGRCNSAAAAAATIPTLSEGCFCLQTASRASCMVDGFGWRPSFWWTCQQVNRLHLFITTKGQADGISHLDKNESRARRTNKSAKQKIEAGELAHGELPEAGACCGSH